MEPYMIENRELKSGLVQSIYHYRCAECNAKTVKRFRIKTSAPLCPDCKTKLQREKSKRYHEKKVADIRAQAIDEFAVEMRELFKGIAVAERRIDEIAEKLKSDI